MKAAYSVLFFILSSAGIMAQVPQLNSYTPASATVFLDFDGEYITGTPWNFSGPIDAQPSGLSASAITEIFNRVAEDYRIFNLNITTDSTVYAAAPVYQRARILITPTNSWYGSGAGGVSYIGSFTWGDDTPSFVFNNLLGNNIKTVAEAVSHESGHALGLQHQSTYNGSCVKTAEYAAGQGSGEIGWAPIMGVGYYKNLTTWHNGTSTIGCSFYQDDISIVAGSPNNFGFRTDDHSNTHSSATPITLTTYDFSAEGLVNSSTDKDVFRFTITNPTNFRLSAIPQSVGGNNSGANVDIRVSLLNQSADTIGQYNPTTLLSAGIDSNLNIGTYYLVVEGVGNINLADYASLGYYTLAGTFGTVLPVHHLKLTGSNSSNLHTLNWNYIADEPIKRVEVQYSKNGSSFETLVQLGADEKYFSWTPVENANLFYRVRVITIAEERSYYSNIVALQEAGKEGVHIVSNLITSHITISSNKDYTYQLLDETGRLVQNGRLITGFNRINTTTVRKGLLLLRVQGNNEARTFKLIKQ